MKVRDMESRNENPSFISLFSGCGGFDIGFLQNGFRCLGAYDNDRNVVNVYRKNIGTHVYECDLTKKALPNSQSLGNVDVVISGSPCQGFSTVGLRKFNDPRNSLLLLGGEIAVQHNAKVFVAENVMGSLSGRHKAYWDKLIAWLTRHGYQTRITICDGQSIGLAQTRKRVILYAWKGAKDLEITYRKRPQRSLANVIQKINGAPNHEYNALMRGSDDYIIASRIPQGKKLCDVRSGDKSVHSWNIPEVFGTCTEAEVQVLETIQKLRRRIRKRSIGDADPVAVSDLKREVNLSDVSNILHSLVDKGYLTEKTKGFYDIKRSFNGKFRRLHMQEPSFTVDTNFGNPKYFIHPLENRGFSVREAARIQGFADDFEFEGSLAQKFRMIGNAVPPPMSFEISHMVKQILTACERQNT